MSDIKSERQIGSYKQGPVNNISVTAMKMYKEQQNFKETLTTDLLRTLVWWCLLLTVVCGLLLLPLLLLVPVESRLFPVLRTTVRCPLDVLRI